LGHDGTAAGTRLLRDINPAPVGSSPGGFETLGGGSVAGDFTALGGRAVFRANDGVHGPEPWIIDGTAEGTRLLLDINPGTRAVSSPGNFTALGGGGRCSSPTMASTSASPGSRTAPRRARACSGTPTRGGGSVPPALSPRSAAGDVQHRQRRQRSEPWITDGTTEGTRLLLDIAPGPGGSGSSGFTALGDGRVVFAALSMDPVNGRDLWITDGTAEGTRLLLDFNPGPGGGVQDNFIALGNGRALFVADDGRRGAEPWISDGTPEGTRLLLDIAPGTGGPGQQLPLPLSPRSGTDACCSPPWTPVNGREPWITDGTAEGTRLLRDTSPAPGGGFFDFTGFTALGDGRALFTADNGINGRELWITDGTAEGTRLLLDINPGAGGSSISTLPGRGPPSPHRAAGARRAVRGPPLRLMPRF
jgi:ELWxxDGT repeat protein